MNRSENVGARRRLVIVPTGGMRSVNGIAVPSLHGEKRLRGAFRLVLVGNVDRILIIGREAEQYKERLLWKYPQLKLPIRSYSADVCTVRDMAKAASIIETEINQAQLNRRVTLVCHIDQYSLAKMALSWHGIASEIEPSGELPPYGRLAKWIYFTISYYFDPTWSTSLTWPLRIVARLRAKWAEWHGL